MASYNFINSTHSVFRLEVDNAFLGSLVSDRVESQGSSFDGGKYRCVFSVLQVGSEWIFYEAMKLGFFWGGFWFGFGSVGGDGELLRSITLPVVRTIPRPKARQRPQTPQRDGLREAERI
jgi:hypothetical protein